MGFRASRKGRGLFVPHMNPVASIIMPKTSENKPIIAGRLAIALDTQREPKYQLRAE
jgi:hypothetical protein